MYLKRYSAKLLLFGEYTIIDNSLALAIPYNDSYGFWSLNNDKSDIVRMSTSSKAVKGIYQYILNEKNYIFSGYNLDSLLRDSENNLWFDSNIPVGYGLGSSGAFCAAIYDSYYTLKPNQINKHLEILAKTESFFHGTSSGIDALVSFLNVPILINNNKSIEKKENLKPKSFSGDAVIFLIDSGIQRKTEPLVIHYNNLRQIPIFRKNYIEPMIKLNNLAIESFIGAKSDLIDIVKEISSLQLEHMQHLIPVKYKELWKFGMESNQFYLKLCGAGGGGFILGFTEDVDILRDLESKYVIRRLFNF